MSDHINIDDILADLRKKVGDIVPHPSTEDIHLTDEQLALRTFLRERKIHYLIHFTDAKNIPSIMENGILSVKQLQARGAAHTRNDEYRHDNALDFISLSVSGMNPYVYRSFRHTLSTIEHGVAIVIDADMLYREISAQRTYCITNAATTNASKGDTLDDFRAMFAEKIIYTTQSNGTREIDRHSEQRNPSEPTDVQAEILWNGCVPTEYILCYWDLEENFFYGD